MITTSTPMLVNNVSPLIQNIDIAYKIVALLFASVVAIVFIISLCKGWWKFFCIAKKIGLFMDNLLPDVLSDLETKKILSKGTGSNWTKIISGNVSTAHSPQELNNTGERIILESGIKKIIDDDLTSLISSLEQLNLKTALDVEQESFYVLKNMEDSDKFIPVKHYLYNNPKRNMYLVIFAGALYLRNKYLAKHKDIV